MDMQMPVMDGLQATGRIRQWEKENNRLHLPILALTAGAFADDQAQCMAAGMDDFITKPISVDKLAAVLAKWSAGRPVSG
jgi:hypothetical protein